MRSGAPVVLVDSFLLREDVIVAVATASIVFAILVVSLVIMATSFKMEFVSIPLSVVPFKSIIQPSSALQDALSAPNLTILFTASLLLLPITSTLLGPFSLAIPIVLPVQQLTRIFARAALDPVILMEGIVLDVLIPLH